MKKNKTTMLPILLWILAGFFSVALLFARVVYPEYLSLTVGCTVILVAALGSLLYQNKKALRGRSAAYGLNSVVTVLLVIAIVGVINFIGARYSKKFDLTANRQHTLSEQTSKVVDGLQQSVKAVLYTKGPMREQYRPLLENYANLNPKFEIEYVDPDRDPARAKASGVKKYGTLQLLTGNKDVKVEEPTEEKLTNALIKLTKEKNLTLCPIYGHGEKNFESKEADGYEGIKNALLGQAYEVKPTNLIQAGNQIPAVCDAIAVLGPTQAFFPAELKAIDNYLQKGGRAVLALDLDLKSGAEFTPELSTLLNRWKIKFGTSIVLDPTSRQMGVDASVPLIANFSKESPITRDFKDASFFPFVRPIEIATDGDPGLRATWLAQSTPLSWGISDLKSLATGRVEVSPDKAKKGPFTVAAAVEGKRKDAGASQDTRIVAFGSSQFGANGWTRFGVNQDFILNSIAWVMNDDSVISIRAKDEEAGRVNLSQKQGSVIFLLTVFLIPLLVAATGIVFWVIRRKM